MNPAARTWAAVMASPPWLGWALAVAPWEQMVVAPLVRWSTWEWTTLMQEPMGVAHSKS